MKFVIDRSKWFRGQGHEESMLLRDDGDLCCLGFYGRALGANDDELLRHGSPSDVPEIFPDWLIDGQSDSDLCNELIVLNDLDFDPAARERQIAKVFARHGVEVEFIDGPVKP